MTTTTPYQVCVECTREYVTAADLLVAWNQALARFGLESESDVTQVVTCPACLAALPLPSTLRPTPRDTVLMMRRLAPGEPAPGMPSGPARVVSWLVWHYREVGGVLVPALVAVAVTPWAWLASGAVAGWWAVRAAWWTRKQAAIKTGRDLPTTDPTTDANADQADGSAREVVGDDGSDLVSSVSTESERSGEGVWL